MCLLTGRRAFTRCAGVCVCVRACVRASGEPQKATYEAAAPGIRNLPCATDATFYCLRWQVLVGPTESLLLLRIARSKYLSCVSELFHSSCYLAPSGVLRVFRSPVRLFMPCLQALRSLFEAV